MQPEPRLVGRVEVREAFDDIAEIGNDCLCPEARRTVAPGPTRDGRRRDIDDVGDVLPLQPTARAQVFEDAGNGGSHGAMPEKAKGGLR